VVDVPKAGLYGGQRLLFRTKRNARKAVIKRGKGKTVFSCGGVRSASGDAEDL